MSMASLSGNVQIPPLYNAKTVSRYGMISDVPMVMDGWGGAFMCSLNRSANVVA